MARGCCASFGLVLTTIALVLALIAQVSQINGTIIPRHLSLISLDTSGFLGALSASSGDGVANLTSIYATASNETATRLPDHDGLRQRYQFGMYSYSAFGDSQDSPDYVTPRGFFSSFAPATALLADVPTKYSAVVKGALPDNVFTEDEYLGTITKAANAVAFVGTATLAIGWLFALIPAQCLAGFSALLSLISTLCLIASSAVYLVIVSKVQAAVQDVKIDDVALGLSVSYGTGLWLLTAAAFLELFALAAMTIACCCGRTEKKDKGKATKRSKKDEKNAPALYPY